MFVKFENYLPDLDPTTPGLITDCSNMIGTSAGYASAPSAQSVGAAALAATCTGAAFIRKTDNTSRLFAGTQTALYELSTTTWTDRTRASGGAYTGSTSSRWYFAQFGDATIATNGADIPQSSSSGAFANLTGAPSAVCISSITDFVMLGNITDAGYQYADGIWWCAQNDHTSWTPSTTTKAGRLRIIGAQGQVTAVHSLGSNFIVYKQSSIHRLTYLGGNQLWVPEQIPGRYGVANQESVLNIDTAHIFIGDDDIYLFDGSRPIPIGDGIRQTFFDSINKRWASRTILQYDRDRRVVYIRYVSVSNNSAGIPIPDKCITIHLPTKKWGRADLSLEAVVQHATSSGTIDSPAAPLTVSTKIDDSPSIPIDSPFWQGGVETAAIIDSTHTLKSLAGSTSSSYLVTGDFGSDSSSAFLTRVRDRYLTKPTSSTMTNYYRENSGTALTIGLTTSETSGKCDVRKSSKWHRVRRDYTGPVQTVGLDIALKPEGER